MCTEHFSLSDGAPMLVHPPKDLPQVIPAQMRRVNNLISRRVNYYSRQNGVEDVTAMHGWPRPISRSCAACARPTSIFPACSPPRKTPSCSACSTSCGPAWSDRLPKPPV